MFTLLWGKKNNNKTNLNINVNISSQCWSLNKKLKTLLLDVQSGAELKGGWDVPHSAHSNQLLKPTGGYMHPQRTGFMICNHYFSSKSVCGNISLKPLYTNTSGVECSNYYDSSSFLIPWSYTVTMIVTCPKCWSDKLTSCGYVCNTTVVKKSSIQIFT